MTTYYIDPADGDNGNSGTSVNDAFADFLPVKFDGKASLEPGDTVKIRGKNAVGAAVTDGHFDAYETGDVNDDPIVVEPYQDETPIIDASTFSDDVAFHLNRGQNYRVRGLVVEGAGSRGIQCRSSSSNNPAKGNVIENCIARRCGASGFRVTRHSYNNMFVNCIGEEQGQDGDGDGFQGNKPAANNEFIECIGRNNADDGFDFWDSEDGRLVRCVSYGNGETSYGETGNGNGYKLGSESGGGGGNVLEGCIAWGNTDRGFDCNNGGKMNTFYNCTAYDTGIGYRTVDGADHVFKNCISHANETDQNFDGGIVHSSNTWNLGIDDPGFASTDSNSDSFLRLASGSPCIDAGVEVGLDYDGDSPDLGSFEYDGRNTSSTQAQLKYYDGSAWQTVDTVVQYETL